MAQEEKKEGSAPPFVPYRTFKGFIRSLTQGVPAKIDKSIMRSMSGGTQAQVMHALKALKLIDEGGNAQPLLRRLVDASGDDAQYRSVLQEVMKHGYPFLHGFDLKNATPKMLQDEFDQLASGGTVAKCMAFFVPAARDAGMELSAHIGKPQRRVPSNGRGRKPRTPAAPATPATPEIEIQGSISAMQKMLLDKYPAFDPGWSPEVQAKWFDGFAKLQAALEGKK